MSEPRLFKVKLDDPALGTTRTVMVQARTAVQSQDAAAKVMNPGERILDIESAKGPAVRHNPIPAEVPFPGTQTHPDDRNA